MPRAGDRQFTGLFGWERVCEQAGLMEGEKEGGRRRRVGNGEKRRAVQRQGVAQPEMVAHSCFESAVLGFHCLRRDLC